MLLSAAQRMVGTYGRDQPRHGDVVLWVQELRYPGTSKRKGKGKGRGQVSGLLKVGTSNP